MPVLLAIETSQHAGSVALRVEDGAIHSESLIAARRHDDDLMPAVDRLVVRLQLDRRALGAVAVSIGPGGFTGLRIAVSTAKVLAETLGAKLIAVPSALVAAEGLDAATVQAAAAEGSAILVALASKRGSFWGTRLVIPSGFWQVTGRPGLIDAASLKLPGLAAVLADEHFPAEARRLCDESGVPVVEPVFEAAACLRAGERLARSLGYTDPLALGPLYPRPPEAATIWEERQKNLSGSP